MSEKSHNKLVNVPMVSMCDLLFRRNAFMVQPPQKKHAHTQQTSFFAMDIADTLCHAPKILERVLENNFLTDFPAACPLECYSDSRAYAILCVCRRPSCAALSVPRSNPTTLDWQRITLPYSFGNNETFLLSRARSNKMFIFPFER